MKNDILKSASMVAMFGELLCVQKMKNKNALIRLLHLIRRANESV